VVIDLTGVRVGTGPARLLDMVAGRSKHAFKTWLAARDQSWRDQVQVVAMDGFTGFKTATTEELTYAVTVMDPFHVVRVRHEVLCANGGGRPLSFGRRSGRIEVEGSLTQEALGRVVGSSPDKAGTGQYCQMVRVRRNEAERCNESEPVVEPP
jgi:hypothetical protein